MLTETVSRSDDSKSTEGPEAGDVRGSPSSAAPAPDGAQDQSNSHGSRAKQKLWAMALGVLALAGALWFGIPWIKMSLSTVSTDDAFVNGHVTFVAARVHGQVARVLVDDDNQVRKGDLLVELDKEPFEIAVAQKRAAVEIAKADLQAAAAKVRGIESQAWSARWKLQHAMETVDDQVALLRARVAAVDKSQAQFTLAQLDFDRAAKLVTSDNIPRAEYDRRQAVLSAARADVATALADVHQIRVALGLPPEPAGRDLGQVPPDLDQTFSSVLEAQGELIQSAAQLGVIHSYEETPRRMLAGFDDQGGVNQTFARLAPQAPDVKQAEAKLEATKRDLVQAELDLRYCDVVAEIDGVVSRRNVNPGDTVQAGQGLMAVRSLSDVWVDANFKETQLRDLRIGQPVDLYVDIYGDHHVFKGRVFGFSTGTGSTLALLPAQNATGNFIKVVQRLPVRIELEDYDADKSPLFVGASVVPYVYIDRPLTGPDAGRFLQAHSPRWAISPSAQDPSGPGK